MDRLPAPGNRDLDAIYKVDPDLSRGHLRLLEAGELIVIGQRQEVDTARRGASDQGPVERLGHTVEERSGTSGDAQVIVVADSVLTGWSDPRGGGRAIGY